VRTAARLIAFGAVLAMAAAGRLAASESGGFSGIARLAWARTPVEELTPARGRIVLDGLWRFRPDGSGAAGWIRVPGTWSYASWPRWNLQGPLTISGTPWEQADWNAVGGAAYEREVAIPKAWKARRIILRIEHPSTRAVVEVGGSVAGVIPWPGGEVDLTDRVAPGTVVTLRVRVTASATGGEELQARGLAGDVFLESRPRGPSLDGVFIRTSVAAHTLALDVDVAGVTAAGTVRLTADILAPGTPLPVRTFTGEATLVPGDFQTVRVEWPWADPVLWDAGRPYMYMLRLRAEGAGIRDELGERFGFREFRIEGKGFTLNGRPVRLRPFAWPDEHGVAGLRACIGHVCDGLIGFGFNLLELWPTDHAHPGNLHFRGLWADAADERGLLLMYPALSIDSFVGADGGTEEAWGAWERAMTAEWRRVRNHPSIVILVSTANRFGYGDDLNPLRIANSRNMGDAGTRKADVPGLRMIEAIRRHDPTRPITSHGGGAVGDFQAVNCDLGLVPLQEREEWLSAWDEQGDRPFMAVEFGTPLACAFRRGRVPFVENRGTEPLMTEFCAIYLGEEAYRLEPGAYRIMIRDKFRGGQSYDRVGGGRDVFDDHPAHQKLQALFDRNTWRSWRTWGLTGGMIPREWGHGFAWGDGEMALPPPEPAQPGSWVPRTATAGCLGLSPGGIEPTEAGRALREVSQPMLCWLAGPADAWTAKDHLFYSGETVRKTLVIVNDGPVDGDFEVGWIAELGGERIAWGKKGETALAGRTLLLPIEFTMLPSQTAAWNGRIIVETHMSGTAFTDSFPLRALPPVPPANGEVLLIDPEGTAKAWIEKLGWTTRRWDGKPAPGRTLVIGRHALDREARLPGSLPAFVEAGGRVVVLGQDPEWLRRRAGFRIARHVSRRAFPVPSLALSPMLDGVDSETLRDWRGTGTLVEETAGVLCDKPATASPEWGWHWGNRVRHAREAAPVRVDPHPRRRVRPRVHAAHGAGIREGPRDLVHARPRGPRGGGAGGGPARRPPPRICAHRARPAAGGPDRLPGWNGGRGDSRGFRTPVRAHDPRRPVRRPARGRRGRALDSRGTRRVSRAGLEDPPAAPTGRDPAVRLPGRLGHRVRGVARGARLARVPGTLGI
jgi:beta-galactosidase